MSGMHLVRGMTTTSTKKRKQKGMTARDKQAKVEHDKWLRKMGVHPEQLAKREKVAVNKIPDYKKDSRSLPAIAFVETVLKKKATHTVANVNCWV